MCCSCCRFCCGAPTKEYTYPYSMMHRRSTTAGIEVAPHYHQLLVERYKLCGHETIHTTRHRYQARYDDITRYLVAGTYQYKVSALTRIA